MNKLGLVLCGGGGKGAYQIGVWRAFREVGLEKYVQAIAGSSVGALNAGLFIQGDLEIAEKIWIEEANHKILTPHSDKLNKMVTNAGEILPTVPTTNWPKKLGKLGCFSREGLVEIIDTYVNCEYIANSPIDYYVTCVEVDESSSDDSKILNMFRKQQSLLKSYFCKGVKYFKMNRQSKNKMKSILLATSALPIVFESEEIEGKKYRDGGILDNTPIEPLVKQGCNVIVVVYLNREDCIDKSLYPNTKIYEIYPTDSLGNFKEGTLDFSSAGAKKRIAQGYKDTMKLLTPIMEMMEIQQGIRKSLFKIEEDLQKSSMAIQSIAQNHQQFQQNIKTLRHEEVQDELRKRFGL